MRVFLRILSRGFVKLGKISLGAVVIAGISLLVSGLFLDDPGLFIFGLYGAATFWVVGFIFIQLGFVKSKSELDSQTLYEWLDNPVDKNFFKSEVGYRKKVDLLENLEDTYDALMVVTCRDLKKLRLLKAHIEVKVDKNARELLFNTFLSVAMAIFIWNLNKGIIWVYAKSQSLSINDITLQQSVSYGTYMLIVVSVSLSIIATVFGYYTGKTRDRMLNSILDVCIEQLKEEEEKNKKRKKRRSTL
ncbi:hypothetical protein [Priestia endophytica]|uniref:Uncharacterized protein n=1 Tax=Priestia endophytica TaxID=135735 RepID=A0AAX1Q713_9BACI|nr:hypothetical protein [Priestia endophytica]RAS75225.1 hypothetical protein A3864_16295 [Priestia endophytica]